MLRLEQTAGLRAATAPLAAVVLEAAERAAMPAV